MRKALAKHMKVAGEPAGGFLAMFLWIRHLPYFSGKHAGEVLTVIKAVGGSE